jgi:hypothetical protein
MYKYLNKLPLVFVLVVCLISCSPANNKPVIIGFSSDSSTIIFSGIDPAGLLQLRNTPDIDTTYSTVISVIELPDEDNSLGREHAFPGKVTVLDSTIVFTPHDLFVKGKSYQVLSFLNARFGNAGMMLTGKLDHKVKPQEVILRR